MKNNIEQQFREALSDYELSYNPSTWDELNKRLDKLDNSTNGRQNNKQHNSNAVKKWTIGASIVAASVALLYLVFQSPQQEGTTVKINNKAEVLTTQKISEKENETIKKSVKESLEKLVLEDNEINSKKKDSLLKLSLIIEDSESLNVLPIDNNHTTTSYIENTPEQIHTITTPAIQEALKIEDRVLNKLINISDVCQGDIIPITNKNQFSIVIISTKGKRTEIKPHQTINYEAIEIGKHQLFSVNSQDRKQLHELESFTVKERPMVSFSIDAENRFKDGIPSILLETHAQGKEFVWNFEKQPNVQHGRTTYAHFYKKGTYQISLTVQHENGCTSQSTQSVTIDKDYNLLAPTAFVPLSGDPRTNKFIPFALLHRKTAFTMQIIDPQKGTIIFQTSTTDGWDGIDSTTRQLVQENTYYIWKVQLENPENGEQREYKGTVTRL